MVFPNRRIRLVSLAVVLCCLPATGWAQAPGPATADFWRGPGFAFPDEGASAACPACRDGCRFRLFRMPVGFLKDPIDIQQDEDLTPLDTGPGPALGMDAAPDDGRLQVTVGNDNPYFDFRPLGAPGGVGFYKLHAQYQLARERGRACCLGIQAVTPAGTEYDGAPAGPTILSPTLAWYQALEDGCAVHGFVGKDLRANSRWPDGLERCLHYGAAFQQPITDGTTTGGHSLHWFIETLGRYHYDASINPHPLPSLEVLPGLHWQAGETWWVSGGVILPVSSPRVGSVFWQITCAWRF